MNMIRLNHGLTKSQSEAVTVTESQAERWALSMCFNFHYINGKFRTSSHQLMQIALKYTSGSSFLANHQPSKRGRHKPRRSERHIPLGETSNRGILVNSQKDVSLLKPTLI